MPPKEDNTTLEARFNRHLMEYAQDKIMINRLLEELKTHDEEMLALLKPMSEVFTGSKFTADLLVKAFKILAVVGSGVAAFLYLTGFFHK